MKKIFKYALETVDEQAIEMPVQAEILCVQTQADTPCLWALVDPDAPNEELRKFQVFVSGHPITEGGARRRYVGTYQLHDGAVVFHVFELLS